jgi:P-type E1-E2 ATPase
MQTDADWIREEPGVGLHAQVGGMRVLLTGRAQAEELFDELPPPAPTGLECIAIVNGTYAATYRFHDVARRDSGQFIAHLGPKHDVSRVLLVSGDREAEVRRLADAVAIGNVHSETSPEEKVAIVRRENERACTVFLGDGINDAPALASATVGIAFGRHTDVTSEAARVVIIDSSLSKVDELMHISYRLRRIALQSAVGGMALSVIGMILAAFGWLPPVQGAIAQEFIDLVAVLNAVRTVAPVTPDFERS